MSRGIFTPKPGVILDPDMTREKHAEAVDAVHKWQQTESWLRNDSGAYGRRSGTSVDDAIRAWRNAEMAIAGWDQQSKIDAFRAGYLEWLAKGNQVADQVALTDLEIEQLPLLERIVARGYRELAKQEHPDTGGTSERFDRLKTAKLQLDRLLVEMKDILES